MTTYVQLSFWHDLRVTSSINPDPPTLDTHPGAALYAKYQSFCADEMGLRDRWFRRLDCWQRDQFNHYKKLLWAAQYNSKPSRVLRAAA